MHWLSYSKKLEMHKFQVAGSTQEGKAWSVAHALPLKGLIEE